LTDAAWQWLATIADKAGMSRNDYLEALAAEDSNPFMETVIPQTTPFMKTVIPQTTPFMKTAILNNPGTYLLYHI
jgi:DNA-binding phage protein